MQKSDVKLEQGKNLILMRLALVVTFVALGLTFWMTNLSIIDNFLLIFDLTRCI